MTKSKLIGVGVIIIGGLTLFLAYRFAIRLAFGVALVAVVIWIVKGKVS